MSGSCIVIYGNIATKNDLTRRLDVHFGDFIAVQHDKALDLLEHLPSELWPNIVFMEWQDQKKDKIQRLAMKLTTSLTVTLYVIGPDELVSREISPNHPNLIRIINPSNLWKTDIPTLLGITGHPISCGMLAFWPSTGVVFNGDGVPDNLEPNKLPFIKLSSKDRIRILEYLMHYGQGPENAKTTSQILDGAWLYGDDKAPFSAKSIQSSISGIRHQIERNASDPRVIKSNPGRPGKNSRTPSGYYINMVQTLSPEIMNMINQVSANPIFSTPKISKRQSLYHFYKRLSEQGA